MSDTRRTSECFGEHASNCPCVYDEAETCPCGEEVCPSCGAVADGEDVHMQARTRLVRGDRP